MPPPKVKAKDKNVELLKLIDKWTRIEIGLRTGFFSSTNIQSKGGLSLANDMADTIDKIRKLVYGTDDIFELANKFKFKSPERIVKLIKIYKN